MKYYCKHLILKYLKRQVEGILYQSALVAFEALELHRLVASLREDKLQVIKKHMQ